MTRDYTPLEPRVTELWFYAKGVGAVLAQELSGGDHREELVKFTRASSFIWAGNSSGVALALYLAHSETEATPGSRARSSFKASVWVARTTTISTILSI